jgi:hypothetical protein
MAGKLPEPAATVSDRILLYPKGEPLTGPGAAAGSGERIGAYEIQDLFGRGGLGEVFLAWDARRRI